MDDPEELRNREVLMRARLSNAVRILNERGAASPAERDHACAILREFNMTHREAELRLRTKLPPRDGQ